MTAKPRKRAPQAEEHTCCVQDCTLVVWKRGLCAEHHDALGSRRGPFARTPPPPPPTPQPDSPIKRGGDDLRP